MGKIEKSLELNITHEILSLADSFWWYLQPISLKRFWRPHWRFPFMQAPKSYATGLPINLEGRAGGGYDVCIESPPNFQGGHSRLLFMQFKAGTEQPFSDVAASIFHGDQQHPNVHVAFDINSNRRHDQHKLLSDLANSAGNGAAVVYVFPRIVNEDQLRQNVGRLLHKTTFLSIAAIDAKAAENNITIDDGNSHVFRTCYNDYDRNEINLLLLLIGKIRNPGSYLGEIFAIRMYRALYMLSEAQLADYKISKFHVADAMIRHVVNLGMYFSIPYDNVLQTLNRYPIFQSRLELSDEYEDMPLPYVSEATRNEFFSEMYGDIVKSLSKYFLWIGDIPHFVKGVDIPVPPSDYTIELTNNGIRFSLEGLNRKYESEDFDEISYSLF